VINVIFNADDFGLTSGVTRAIVEASERGVILSTTAMVCRGNDAVIREWAPRMCGDIGLHLQLTDGVPCLPSKQVSTLVTSSGAFPRTRGSIGPVDAFEVETEWRAQIARLRVLGVKISHIDTHHHVHWREDLLPVYVELARSLQLPARSGAPHITAALRAAGVPCPAVCDLTWGVGNITSSHLIRLVRKNAALHAGEVIEIMCHPGHVDGDLLEASTLVIQRALEFDVFCSKELREGLKVIGATSTSMKVLKT
jgi:chitin disaccharide deacetylase